VLIQDAPNSTPSPTFAATACCHTATAVARLYADIADAFVLDDRDAPEAADIAALGLDVVSADTLATGPDRVALAETVLAVA
jgi:hypothetical protein